MRILRGPWDAAEGTEIRGITDATWYYASCFVELDSDEILELTQRSIAFVPRFAPGSIVEAVAPASTIEDVLRDDYGAVRIVFADGTYLENVNLPGGSRIILESLSGWTAEELEESQLSLVDDRRTNLATRFRV